MENISSQKIVVLDGYPLNPGDLDWQPFEVQGACTIYDRTSPDEVVERAAGASIVITNKTPLSRGHLAALPSLRYVGVLATGYNIVDAAAARERGIAVTNVPGYGAASVAQHAFALLLELTHHVGAHAESVQEGRWCKCPDFSYWNFPLVELSGLTLGIVGCGTIGRATANIGQAFGMSIIASSMSPKAPEENVKFVSTDEVFRRADVVSLHCPLTEETAGMVHRERLGAMKPNALLINTSRGGLIVEQDLADALGAGRIAGAGLDVLSSEPPQPENPLLKAKNCLVTPHIAWATQAARRRLLAAAAENLRAFLGGAPVNVVNPK